MKFRLGIICGVILLAQTVQAETDGQGFFFAPTLFYYDIGTKENGSESDQSRMDLDLSAGYSFGRLMLGGKYYHSKIDSNGSGDSKTTAIGAIIGFEHKGFKLLGSYNFLNVEQKIDEPDLKYGDGHGLIFEAMYICDFGGWGFGPKLFYRDFTYESQKFNGKDVKTFKDRQETELLPFLAFYFKV